MTYHDCGTMEIMSARTSRTWIVQLNAKAGFRLEDQQQVTIVAGPATTLPVHGVRLRNHTCWATDDHSDGAPTFVGGFVVETAGEFANKDEAVSVLANLANPYLHVLAVVTNAAVEEPEDLFAYSPPVDPKDTGEFVVQLHSQARSPAARLRRLGAADLMPVLEQLSDHPRAERLHRAMAHFRMALNNLSLENRVLSAESLWMVVENLSRVVSERFCDEHGVDTDARDAKHQVALAMGFQPKEFEEPNPPAVQALIDSGELDPKRLKRDNTHLDALDSHIRRDVLLGSDKVCYRQLREMSDGFEHGYMNFGDVRTKSAVTDAAFGHLRRAILHEIGVGDTSPLFDDRFDSPQAVWRPAFECHGEYTDNSGRIVDLSRDTFNEPWPDAPGLMLIPSMKAVIDKSDGTRTITLQVDGTTTAMPDSQTARVTESRWISPSGSESEVLDRDVTIRLNGEVVEDAVIVPGEPPQD